jgi:hypothetical protein
MLKTQLSKSQLAERYATLKVQADQVAKQLRDTADELICLMSDSEILRTPEYSVSKNQGRKVLFWTETGKPHKKQFEQELLKQGFMAEKVGESYIQVRWAKETDSE